MGHEGAGIASVRGDAVEPPGQRRGGTSPDRPNPLADLRPVGPGAVLDGAFDLFRFRAGRLLALTASLFVPVWLLRVLAAVLSPPPLDPTGGEPVLDLGWTAFTSGDGNAWSYGIGALQLLALAVLGLCVGHLASALSRGQDVELRDLGRLVLTRGWVALVILPFTTAAHFAGLLCMGIGFVFTDAVVFITSTLAGAEGVGPLAAIGRTWRLTTAEYGRCLVIALGGLAITVVVQASLSYGPMLLVLQLAPTEATVGVATVLGSVVLLFTAPLTACIAARAHLDLCCRVDGYDLELRRARLGLT